MQCKRDKRPRPSVCASVGQRRPLLLLCGALDMTSPESLSSYDGGSPTPEAHASVRDAAAAHGSDHLYKDSDIPEMMRRKNTRLTRTGPHTVVVVS
jgi:hypothetical protein